MKSRLQRPGNVLEQANVATAEHGSFLHTSSVINPPPSQSSSSRLDSTQIASKDTHPSTISHHPDFHTQMYEETTTLALSELQRDSNPQQRTHVALTNNLDIDSTAYFNTIAQNQSTDAFDNGNVSWQEPPQSNLDRGSWHWVRGEPSTIVPVNLDADSVDWFRCLAGTGQTSFTPVITPVASHGERRVEDLGSLSYDHSDAMSTVASMS